MLHHSGIVRKLAARKKIQELEESTIVAEYDYELNEARNDIKKTIIQLGLENNLASQYTSFVGIDDMTGDTLSEEPMWTREIKNQIASRYGGGVRSSMSFGATSQVGLLSGAPKLVPCSLAMPAYCNARMSLPKKQASSYLKSGRLPNDNSVCYTDRVNNYMSFSSGRRTGNKAKKEAITLGRAKNGT